MTESTTDVDATMIERSIDLAMGAREASYCPYTDFAMGAAILDTDGGAVTGALVENVSLGLAMCSERSALFAAVTARLRPRLLTVASQRTDGRLTFPCGACLQVANEIAGPDLTVVAVDEDGSWEAVALRDLLPRPPQRFSTF